MNEFIALKWKDKLCRSLNLNLTGFMFGTNASVLKGRMAWQKNFYSSGILEVEGTLEVTAQSLPLLDSSSVSYCLSLLWSLLQHPASEHRPHF